MSSGDRRHDRDPHPFYTALGGERRGCAHFGVFPLPEAIGHPAFAVARPCLYLCAMPPEHPVRADAVRNREHILEIAHEAFAADGSVSLNAIAKRAGVGPGTLYRHF